MKRTSYEFEHCMKYVCQNCKREQYCFNEKRGDTNGRKINNKAKKIRGGIYT